MPKFTSKEVAIAYLAQKGQIKTPEKYLLELIESEALFAELLATDDLKNVLAKKSLDSFVAMAK